MIISHPLSASAIYHDPAVSPLLFVIVVEGLSGEFRDFGISLIVLTFGETPKCLDSLTMLL